jgi:hypothetical protein
MLSRRREFFEWQKNYWEEEEEEEEETKSINEYS